MFNESSVPMRIIQNLISSSFQTTQQTVPKQNFSVEIKKKTVNKTEKWLSTLNELFNNKHKKNEYSM